MTEAAPAPPVPHICFWCADEIRWAGNRWLSCDWADLDGFCRRSPEHAHWPTDWRPQVREV